MLQTGTQVESGNPRHVREALSICVLDDDSALVDISVELLERAGFGAKGTSNPEEALEELRSGKASVLLSDIQMPVMDGFRVLGSALQHDPEARVILVTGQYSIDSAIEAIKRGAYDYLPKPLDYPRLFKTLDELAVALQRRSEIHELEDKLVANMEFEGIVGHSPAMADVFDLVRKVAKHYYTALVTGPTGAGKELFARALHSLSPVATERFVICNCSALVDTLLESQLFGHVRGAFTGAFDTRAGLFEYANGGTVFLDEIGETSLQMQAKLLRVIQNREIQKVGSPEVKKVDVHIVAATNRDLRAEVSTGTFREDLFYRLSTIEIHVPGLAERAEDIPLLIRYFLKRSNEQYGKHIQGVTRRAEAAFVRHPWPGNVRELENAISRAVITASGDFLDLEDLPKDIQNGVVKASAPGESWRPATLEEVERDHIQRVMDMCGGNQVRAAEILGIGRTSLYRHLKRTANSAAN